MFGFSIIKTELHNPMKLCHEALLIAESHDSMSRGLEPVVHYYLHNNCCFFNLYESLCWHHCTNNVSHISHIGRKYLLQLLCKQEFSVELCSRVYVYMSD